MVYPLSYFSFHPVFHNWCRATLAGMRNISKGPPWGIYPTKHRTMSRRSTTDLHLAPMHRTKTKSKSLEALDSQKHTVLDVQIQIFHARKYAKYTIICQSKRFIWVSMLQRQQLRSVTLQCSPYSAVRLGAIANGRKEGPFKCCHFMGYSFWLAARIFYIYHTTERIANSTTFVIQGRKEMFYLTTHSTHFIYGYMASDIW